MSDTADLSHARRGVSKGPYCFMHVPKSGGVSVHAALERAFPPGSLSPKQQDTSVFCAGFTNFEQLPSRIAIAHGEHEIASLGESRVVSGHFCLETLLRVAPPSSIATVLREPRARVLSLYAYWRLTPSLRDSWHCYKAIDHAQRPLEDFLAEPQIAQATDNQVCRMLLHGDRRIPLDEFVAANDIAGVAAAAIERLDTLGSVGVLEMGDAVWQGLSLQFGVALEPVRANVTGAAGTLAHALPAPIAITPKTIELLEQRTAADAILYQHELARSGVRRREIERMRDAALAEQLARFGDVAGQSAAAAVHRAGLVDQLQSATEELRSRLDERDRTIATLSEAYRQMTDELERARFWLDAIQGSTSWRSTVPLRAAKRSLVGSLAAASPRLRAWRTRCSARQAAQER